MFVSSKKIFITTTAWCIMVSLLFTGCDMFFTPKTPLGYVLPRPKKTILDKKLNEISGLYYLEETGGILTISDNKQKVYHLTLDGKVTDYLGADFAEQQDFEDILKVDSSIYVLVSNGTILSVNKSDSEIITERHPFWSTQKNDFESMYYDDSAKSIIMICKSCAHEKGKNIRTAYRFDLESMRFDTAVYYTINAKEVQNYLKDGVVKVNPSAAAIHPIEKRLYILSSSGNVIIVTDLKGKVQHVSRLHPTFYPQAEGITFAPNGDLYISNEAKLGKPTLLRIPYKYGK
ncbi:MAG TPA: SdiA-regulated domain-containing protein [Chitinophagaceae bacterium]